MNDANCGKHGVSGIKYSQQYDCMYCAKCDRWTTIKCKMQGCLMCESRPKKPSLVIKDSEPSILESSLGVKQ